MAKKRPRRPLEEDNRLKAKGTVGGTAIEIESDSLSSNTRGGDTISGDGQSTNPDNGELGPDDEGSNSIDIRPLPQLKPGKSGIAGMSPHQLTKGNVVNPLSSPSLKKLNKSGSKPKPSLPLSRGVMPKSSPQGSAAPNKISVPSRTEPSPIGPPNPSQPENPTRVASQTVEKNTIPEKVVQGGPPNSADVGSDPNPDAVAATKDPNPSRVAEPELSQNGTIVEPGNRPEGSPAKSPPDESTQDLLYKSDIESLYASPSPEKTIMELDPIELDSDPDFEMMELMLLSHRGPSSQSQSIKKESTAQSPAFFETKRPLKRQRSHPSLLESSQVPTQPPQADLKQVKRLRVNGPHSPGSVMVLNDRKKHPEFWDLDGTVILQVDDVLFRTMRSTLSKASPWFQRLFSEERHHLEIMAGCPVYQIEEDFNHLDFANLLRGLENGL